MTTKTSVSPRRRWHAPQRGMGPAFFLSLGAHALLLLAIAFAVRWNTSPVGPVTVELWGGSPPPVAVDPPRPAPAPLPAPPPPPPPIERKADIVLEPKKIPPKAEPKKEEPKKEEPKKEDLRKAEAEKKAAQELAARKAAEERLRKAAEEKAAQQRREAELERLAAAAGVPGTPGPAATGVAGISKGYESQIVGCVRPHIIFNVPDGVRPRQFVAEFHVQLLPTGEQLGAPKLLKASGLPAYDQAVERAIRRCDPFPRPQSGSIPRDLRLTFDPVETQ